MKLAKCEIMSTGIWSLFHIFQNTVKFLHLPRRQILASSSWSAFFPPRKMHKVRVTSLINEIDIISQFAMNVVLCTELYRIANIYNFKLITFYMFSEMYDNTCIMVVVTKECFSTYNNNYNNNNKQHHVYWSSLSLYTLIH